MLDILKQNNYLTAFVVGFILWLLDSIVFGLFSYAFPIVGYVGEIVLLIGIVVAVAYFKIQTDLAKGFILSFLLLMGWSSIPAIGVLITSDTYTATIAYAGVDNDAKGKAGYIVDIIKDGKTIEHRVSDLFLPPFYVDLLSREIKKDARKAFSSKEKVCVTTTGVDSFKIPFHYPMLRKVEKGVCK